MRRIWAVALAACLGGCAMVGPDFVQPESQVQSNWIQALSVVPAPAEDMSSDVFWSRFGDPTLVELIAQARLNSPTLRSTLETVTQAQSQVRADQGNQLPSVTLSAGGNRNRESYYDGANQGTISNITTRQLAGQLSWELDFWGRLRRATLSDMAVLQGSQAGFAAARISLEASVASAYCNVRMMERRIEVAEKNLAQQKENKRIAEAKWRRGATSELDYQQSQSQYEQTRSQLPALRQSLEQYQHALSVLVGETPDYFARNKPALTGLPSVPAALPIGAPRDLLRRRPDLLQAEYNAVAQSQRIGVAEAALYPTFTLTGSLGYSGTGGGNMFNWDSRSLQYGAGLSLPIFDRGVLKSQVQIQDSLFRQAVLSYQNLVLSAQQGVEDGLSSVVGQKGQVEHLTLADAAAQRATRLAMDQYRAGQVDYTTVSSAEQTRANTSDALVQAQGGVLQAYINLFVAIGGGWEPDIPRPDSKGVPQ
jgi:NodT family efflux transporter outer membrane factor (OMF) lipoprotein